ncbi:MAG: SNF2-related protein, partial [Thermodesulfobacteriota bacterium]|nr:SNF2-related protein [Thermodesulfobacteriota bacterium]
MLELLSTVHMAAERSELISELIETGELFHPLAWTSGEAFTFLKEISAYEECGILCRIPNWWKGNQSSVRMNISIGDSQPSFVGMDAILNFNAQLLLGDTQISEAEARKLLEESEGLAFIKNKWVAVDPEKLRETLEAYEKARGMVEEDGLSIRDALRMQLNPEQMLGTDGKDTETTVSTGQWLESVIQKLRKPELTPSIKPESSFKANLREYQQKGLNWLYFLHSLRFGACLADDMGLGKTIELLGFLSAVKAEKIGKTSLLVIPASLISNWVSEIGRFCPDLKYFVAHPGMHPKNGDIAKDEKALDGLDLVITTYALVQRYEWLQSYTWAYIILDEAQAIKNPGTKQTRAIKKFKAMNRIVMTGTPIENRLSDIWSLFDFLNPGLLGNNKEFGKFSKGLKTNPEGYSRLRKLISPYILRRLKTDKYVISDLPEKVEMKTYAPLSKKQI